MRDAFHNAIRCRKCQWWEPGPGTGVYPSERNKIDLSHRKTIASGCLIILSTTGGLYVAIERYRVFSLGHHVCHRDSVTSLIWKV